MAQQIFSTGSLNVAGICHAVCCKWVKESRILGNVVSVQQLGSPMAMFMNWQMPANWQGINDNYHLPPGDIETQPQLIPGWIAEKTTRINGFALVVLWGGGLNIAEGRHQAMGHTVAVRKEAGHCQYFDPNIGAIEFTNSIEMFEWLPANAQGPYMMYPMLRNRSCEFVKV